MATKHYNAATLWGAVAIAAGATALVVGAAVFIVMQAQRNEQQPIDQQPVDQQPVSLPTAPSADGTKTTFVPINGGLAITYPGTYDMYQDVTGDRRGSFAAFDYLLNIQTLVAVSPALQSIEFFNADSVALFAEKYPQQPETCRGLCPTHDDLLQERRTLETGQLGADGELVEIDGYQWLARTDTPPDGRNLLRRYSRFIGETRLEITFWLEDAGDSEATDVLLEQVDVALVIE